MKSIVILFLATFVAAASAFDCATPIKNNINGFCAASDPKIMIPNFAKLQVAFNQSMVANKLTIKCGDVKSDCEAAIKAYAACIPSGEFASYQEKICKDLTGK